MLMNFVQTLHSANFFIRRTLAYQYFWNFSSFCCFFFVLTLHWPFKALICTNIFACTHKIFVTWIQRDVSSKTRCTITLQWINFSQIWQFGSKLILVWDEIHWLKPFAVMFKWMNAIYSRCFNGVKNVHLQNGHNVNISGIISLCID